MAKEGKQRFVFECLQGDHPGSLSRRDEGPDVWVLQALLTSAGYLARERLPGHYCPWTEAAVRHFQKCYGLPDTGRADADTLRLMSRPRCGVPDVPADSSGGPAPFVLRGCKYPTTELTYAFFNSTGDLPPGRDRAIVREAFAVWAEVTPLRFTEVGPSDSPAFSIAWERMDHGDGSPFDEGGSIQGNTLAHAFYPPPCGGRFAGALHFDEFERWVDQASSSGVRLLNVAIHEIGHLLGLSHSNARDAIMFAFYSDDVDQLAADDLAGIQALYGEPGSGLLRGRLRGAGDSQLHRLTLRPGRVRIQLSGPSGSDFDLYVRANTPPTRQSFDARGFTADSREEISFMNTDGDLFVLVDSWRGSGEYELSVLA